MLTFETVKRSFIMLITKKNLLIIGFLFIFAICFALLGVEAEASNVNFETFVNSVKAGEFVLSNSDYDTFMDAIEAGDTDLAMDIYRDYFNMDDDVDDEELEECEEVEAVEEVEIVEEVGAVEETVVVEAEVPENTEVVEVEVEVSEAAEVVEESDSEEIEAVEAIEVIEETVVNEPEAESVVPESDGTSFGVSEAEYSMLCRIVEAEAPNEGEQGKLLVANVVLNRVASPSYPSTISGVISQSGQFGPYRTGKINRVTPNAETIAAVNRALSGENDAPAVVSFRSARASANWGNRSLAFTYGNHNFFY